MLDLWGRCQQDSDFVAANADPITKAGVGGSSGGGGGGGEAGQQEGQQGELVGANAGDLESILALIKELLVAKSPVQATRHYHALQQVAHRVWQQHFTHKRQLRGKVVETFEALSNLAEIMAAKIRSVTDQLSRSREAQKGLQDDLGKLQVQRRALEVRCFIPSPAPRAGTPSPGPRSPAAPQTPRGVPPRAIPPQVALERRDALVREMSGVKRSERRDMAAAYQEVLMQDAASWGPLGSSSRPSSRHGSRAPSPTAGRRPSSATPTGRRDAAVSRSASAGPRRPASARPSVPVPPPASSAQPRGTLAAAQHAEKQVQLSLAASLAAAAAAAAVPRPPAPHAAARPASAPAHRPPPSAQATPRLGEGEGNTASLLLPGEESAAPGAAPWTPGPAGAAHHPYQPHHHVLDLPDGGHWTSLVQQQSGGVGAHARPHSARAQGALFSHAKPPSGDVAEEPGPGRAGVAAAAAVAAAGAFTKTASAASRWQPPRRADIEASFLTRLQRAATPGSAAPKVLAC